jgi:hypothetical protein
MRKMTWLLLFASITLPAVTQAQSLTGKWTARYQVGLVVNGEFKSDTATAEVVINQKGDSVSGTWQMLNAPQAVPPRVFTGTFVNGHLSLTAETEARIRRNDDEETVKMVTRYEADLKNDELSGTMTSKSADGSIESPPRAWTAQRAK